MRLKKELLFKRKMINILHSTIVILGTAFLLSLATFLIFGFDGIIWAIAIWLFMVFIIPLVNPKSVLKNYDSRELSYSEVPNLYDAIDNLSKNANLEKPPSLYYIKSSDLIAFSTGTTNNSAIALSDGILRLLNNKELYGVLGHEMSHIKNNDIWLMQVTDVASKIAIASSYLGQIILVILIPFLLYEKTLYIISLFIVFLFIPPLTMLMQVSLSRIREYGADLDAVMLTNDPAGLKSALLKLNTIEENLLKKVLNPFSKSKEPSMLRTHPKTSNRIKRLEELERKKEFDDGFFQAKDLKASKIEFI